MYEYISTPGKNRFKQYIYKVASNLFPQYYIATHLMNYGILFFGILPSSLTVKFCNLIHNKKLNK